MNIIKSKILKILPILIFVLALSIASIAHGYNMWHYPYFENDEGTYFFQAYSVAYEGKLTNYTYWYDHAPAGWMQIAAWMRLTGGPFAFGYSLYSARVYMLIVHILSSILLFLIVKKITKKDWVSGLSVIIFSLSPLALYFQRRLLLDNIMTFWMLLSLYLIIKSKERLAWIIAAGITLTIAVLSKETALFTVPGYLFLVYKVLNKGQRRIGLTVFITPVLIGVSYFILYAILKGEFLPGPGHVSLIQTWLNQLKRGTDIPVWNKNSEFIVSFKYWFSRDPFLIVGQIIAMIWALLIFKKRYLITGIGLILFFLWLFFVRGGTTITFYIIPALALGSIIVSLFLNELTKIKYIGPILVTLILLSWLMVIDKNVWVLDETTPQKESVDWVKKNIDPNAIIAVDNAQLLDIQKSRFKGDPAFPRAHWFYKLQLDPAIRNGVVKNDWHNINYLLLSHEMLKQVGNGYLDFIAPTISHSTVLASWGPLSSGTYINLEKEISTNGDWAKMLKVEDLSMITLGDSWNSYKKNFITYEGKVVDPQRNITTSEGQSYAMLRSVIIDDKSTFGSIWNWTKSHLQFRTTDKLFSWKWGIGKNGQEQVLDSSPATDADIDTATSLIMASRKWHNPDYENEAKIIIGDIWKNEVVNLNGNYYLLAGTWAGYGNSITVNPSYISPAAFKLFAEIDKKHNWNALADDSYVFLNRLSAKSKVGLIPDWISVDKETESIGAPKEKDLGVNFSYDAMRIYWRISQDYYWYNSTDAKIFLSKQKFLRDYFNKNKKIPDIIGTSGKVNISGGESNAFYGSFLPFFQVTDKGLYEGLKANIQTDYKDGAWKEFNNYYTQNWVWLGLALSENKYNYEK